MARKTLRETLPSKNLRGLCCVATASCFAVYSNGKVLVLVGTNWGEFTAAGKRAARFAAAILWAESVANNSPCPKPLACCDRYAKRRKMANQSRLPLQTR